MNTIARFYLKIALTLVALTCIAISSSPLRIASAQQAAPAAQRSHASALQTLIAGARREAEIHVSYGADIFGGGPGLRELVAGMNHRYGLNARVIFTPGVDTLSMMTKLTQELAAGQPADTDLYVGTAQDIASADTVRPKTLRPYPWRLLVDRPLLRDRRSGFDPVAQDDLALASLVIISGITYNSQLVPPDLVPHRLTDLLNPRFKGKIAATPYGIGFRDLAADSVFGKPRVIDFLHRFSPQLGGLIRCGDAATRVGSGEFWMIAIDCGGENAYEAQIKGAPVKQVIPDDAVLVQPMYTGVPVNSRAPNAAALLATYFVSAEGQAILRKYWASDLYTLPESRLRQQIDKAYIAGAKLVVESSQWWAARGDTSATDKEIRDILSGK